MRRMVRVAVVTVTLFLIAWVIKEVFGTCTADKMEDLVHKIRMNEAV
jgi:hypothetical protein